MENSWKSVSGCLEDQSARLIRRIERIAQRQTTCQRHRLLIEVGRLLDGIDVRLDEMERNEWLNCR